MRRRLTPQEKKATSYLKDRRNTYGENSKASRRIIPLRKAGVNRAYRRRINGILSNSGILYDSENLDQVEAHAKNVRRDGWRKVPDRPLAEVLERKLDGRVRHTAGGKTLRKRANDFAAGLRIQTIRESKEWLAVSIGAVQVFATGASEQVAINGCRLKARVLYMESCGSLENLKVHQDLISYTSR